YGAMFNVKQKQIPLADDFSIDTADYVVDHGEPVAGVIFANPNAPTGRVMGLQEIADIAQAFPESAVVVDEAYIDFGGESAVGLLGQLDNIVVVQTLSKSRALAGLRVGYL